MSDSPMMPWDEHNQKLVAGVQPPNWLNPTPKRRYHLVVIGAGTAGLVAAAGAAGLGANVALVERHLMGGDCLNFGCVPSKAILRSAKLLGDLRRAAEWGIEVAGETRVNFASIMERMRRLRSQLSPNDSAERFRGLGVDVFFGDARFAGPDSVVVGDATLHFRRAIIAAGTRAFVPDISGLREAGYLTNETVFSLTDLPKRLAVLGGGPIGCELAQAFARFGSDVTVIGNQPTILPREDAEASARVADALRRDGIRLLLSANLIEARSHGSEKTLSVQCAGRAESFTADAILVATGRQPNVANLGLETANIAFDTKTGVHVNDRLQTSNGRVFAAGDIASTFKFTHAADALARIAIQNSLFYGRARASALTIPWCTYTDPELAHVGLTEYQAKEQGIAIQTFRQDLTGVDRAVLDGETAGFVKIHVAAGTDRIVGATIVARHAGEMISEISLAMVSKKGLKTLAGTIHPYPTQAEAIKKTGDAWNRTRLSPLVKWLFSKWFAWT
jgi:pyruvate/2-oxoglutarate dehydrogenase complex dihydrolipoamide dehydrogenase (E3) component